MVAVAVAVTPAVGGVMVTVGIVVYPLPVVVSVIAETAPPVKVANAAAPVPPPPVIVTAGAEV